MWTTTRYTMQPNSPSFIPRSSSLISIKRTETFDWKLYNVPAAKASKLRYLTLNHCWGRALFLTLTASTRAAMESGMALQALPTTFRDAIKVARHLGHDYLWIDSLCILQDSVEDWRAESAHMQEIDRYSSGTIAASAAACGDDGCFFPRDTHDAVPAQIAVRWADAVKERDYLLMHSEYFAEQISQAPLNQRAWVVQERILSPRTIHFGRSQVFWECGSELACEAFPRELPQRLRGQEQWLAQYCASQLDELEGDVYDSADDIRERLRKIWSDLVWMYARCQLTRPEDKLLAMSGLVQRFYTAFGSFAAPLWGDRYLAGLWESDLPHSLLWSVSDPKRSGAVESVRPPHYRAPSWSWAVVDAPIQTVRRYYKDRGTCLVEHLSAWAVPLSDDLTGQVSDGLLRICGRLVQATFDSSEERRLCIPDKSFKADVQPDFPAALAYDRFFMLLPVRMFVQTVADGVDYQYVQGLVLARQHGLDEPENAATSRRAGYWEANAMKNAQERVRKDSIAPLDMDVIWKDCPEIIIEIV